MVYNNGRFDYAVWDPISGRNSLPNKVLRMTVHTAVTSSGDIYGPNRGPGDTYAHFYNPLSARIRQHQEIHHKAYSDGQANGYAVGVEHQDNGREMPLSASQIDDDARLFAHLVTHYGLPNRIATTGNTQGLAWHRLGIKGNFPPYDPSDRKTWTGSQTGQNWSDSYGKVCPWNTRIDQIDDIWAAAQKYIDGGAAIDTDTDTDTGDKEEEDEMPTEVSSGYTTDHSVPADSTWRGLQIEPDKDPGSAFTLLTGPGLATGTLALVVQAAKADTQVLVRTVHSDVKSGSDSKIAYTGFSQETYTSGGTTQIVLPFTEHIHAPAKGWTRHLRFQVKAFGGGELLVADARARALFWKE